MRKKEQAARLGIVMCFGPSHYDQDLSPVPSHYGKMADLKIPLVRSAEFLWMSPRNHSVRLWPRCPPSNV